MTIDEYEAIYIDHHADCDAIAALLRSTGAPELAARAGRIESCATSVTGTVCPDCGEFHVQRTQLCRDRLCPNCGWVLSKLRYHAVLAAVEEINATRPVRVMHAVLTIKHDAQSDLRELVTTLTRAFGLLRKMEACKPIVGSVRALELTHSEQAGFHPHIHALFLEDRACAGLTPAALRRAWRTALGADYDPEVWYQESYAADGSSDPADAVREACKYSIKPGALTELDAGALATVAKALRGVRLTSADGVLHGCLRACKCHYRTDRAKTGCEACHTSMEPVRTLIEWDFSNPGFKRYGGALARQAPV